jgi:hypothetical protein
MISPSHRALAAGRRSRRALVPALLLLATVGLHSCGSGGGGAPAVQAQNLTGTSLEVVSATPMGGHQLELLAGIASSRELHDVALAFYVLNKEDVDQGLEEPRQFLVDEFVIPTVPAGASKHPATIVVPTDLEPAGDYVIVARIDPLDLIQETNEDDNLPGESSPQIVIEISNTLRDTPDLTLEKVTLDADTVVLEQNLNLGNLRGIPDVPNHHLGATALIATTGAKVQGRVEMSVALEIPNVGYQALQVWEPAQKRHVTSWFVPELHPDKPNEVHVDVMIPEALRSRLVTDIKNTKNNVYNVRFTVNGGKSINEWEDGSQRWTDRWDNEIVVQVVLLVPADAPPVGLAWGEDFEKSWVNSVFGIGVDFRAAASIDQRGLIGEVEAEIPVRLFGQDLEFFGAEIYGQDTPQDTRQSRFSAAIEVLGQTVYSKSVTDPVFEYTETPFKVVKSIEKKAIFFAGPVPIQLTAGATGELGVDLVFRMDTASASLAGKPYFTISAYASAAINLVAVTAGARGDVELLADDFETSLTAELAVTNGGRYLDGRLLLNATNVLTGPNGRLYLFVTYPGVKICRVLGVPVPCGVVTHRKEKTIAQFETFTKTDVLFHKPFTAFRVDLQN